MYIKTRPRKTENTTRFWVNQQKPTTSSKYRSIDAWEVVLIATQPKLTKSPRKHARSKPEIIKIVGNMGKSNAISSQSKLGKGNAWKKKKNAISLETRGARFSIREKADQERSTWRGICEQVSRCVVLPIITLPSLPRPELALDIASSWSSLLLSCLRLNPCDETPHQEAVWAQAGQYS